MRNIRKNHLIIVLLLFTVGYLVLKDFIAIGFTNSDDSSNYVSSLLGGVFTDARAWAEGQGRFYFYYRVPWARMPYLIDHVYWLKTLQYLPVISAFVLISVILGTFLRSFYFGVIVISFLFGFFTIPSAAYQPPTAYPFLFTTDVVLFLLSIFFYQRYQRTQRYAYFIIFLLFFSIPMFSYESYVVFYFGLLFYVASRHLHLLKKKNFRLFLFNKEVLPILGIGIVFIILYFGYRFMIGYSTANTSYDGNTLATKIDLYNVLKLIHNFNSSAFPMHTYFKNRSVFSAFDPNFKNSLLYVLSHLSFQEVLKPILLSSLVYFSLTKTPIHLLTLKRSLLIFFGSIIMCYAQNLLFGFTQKYNQDVYTLDGYVTTYHSFFGISLAIIVLLVYPATRIKKGVIKKIYFLGIGIIFFVITSLIYYYNKVLSKDLQIVHHKFQLVNALMQDKDVKRLGKKSMIKMEQLNETPSLVGGSVCYGHFSWIGYLYGKSNKQFKLLSDDKTMQELIAENRSRSYCLFKQLMNKEKEVVTLLFSPLENQPLKTNQLISNKLLIYVYLPNDQPLSYTLKVNGELHRLVIPKSENIALTSNVHCLQKVNSEIYKTYIYVKNINLETVVSE